MATVIKGVIIAVSVFASAATAYAGSADCAADKQGPAPKLFERTARTGKPQSALEAPAAVARWIGTHAKTQVAISVKIVR